MVDGIQEFIESLRETPVDTIKTYSAVVSKIDDEGVVWVYLAGSNKETPVASASAEVKNGDNVNVEWRNNKLYIAGNVSNPSAGVTRVKATENVANTAIQDASRANEAANIAFDSASLAKASAVQALTSATEASASAMDAKTAADEAKEDASRADASATNAMTSATNAMASATSAMASASNALDQLAVIENVVGVLDLLSKHGTYELTQDTQAQAGKWYFTRSGAGTTANPYVYSVADISVGTDPTGYYELTDIDQAVTNYVSSHLALTNDGLSLQQDGSDYRLVISTNGLKIIGANGATVAEYGQQTTIGDTSGFHVKIDGTELGFYQGDRKVAYISNNQLYITQSVVLQQMDLGIPVSDGGLGQWSWKVHPNGQNPSRNNLNLKWIG